jgi:archaellin
LLHCEAVEYDAGPVAKSNAVVEATVDWRRAANSVQHQYVVNLLLTVDQQAGTSPVDAHENDVIWITAVSQSTSEEFVHVASFVDLILNARYIKMLPTSIAATQKIISALRENIA